MTPCTVLHQVLVLVLPFILLFFLPLSLPLSLPHPNQIRIVLYNDTKDRIILYNATIRSPAGIHFSPVMETWHLHELIQYVFLMNFLI